MAARNLFFAMSARRCRARPNQREPAALRKAEHGDAVGIDERHAAPGIPAPGRRRAGSIDRRAAAAGAFQAARTEAVDGERDIAPGSDPLSPAFIELLPISIATMQQHDGGRGAGGARLPQITLQRLRYSQAGSRFRRRSASDSCRGKARAEARGQERGDEGGGLGELRHGPPSRNSVAGDQTPLYIPKIFRALAFITLGRISSRISSLAKSASQRSGVITGQSEPNSILSCRIELM